MKYVLKERASEKEDPSHIEESAVCFSISEPFLQESNLMRVPQIPLVWTCFPLVWTPLFLNVSKAFDSFDDFFGLDNFL